MIWKILSERSVSYIANASAIIGLALVLASVLWALTWYLAIATGLSAVPSCVLAPAPMKASPMRWHPASTTIAVTERKITAKPSMFITL